MRTCWKHNVSHKLIHRRFAVQGFGELLKLGNARDEIIPNVILHLTSITAHELNEVVFIKIQATSAISVSSVAPGTTPVTDTTTR